MDADLKKFMALGTTAYVLLILMGMFVQGAIGALIGRKHDRVFDGAVYGALMGPLGWLMIFLDAPLWIAGVIGLFFLAIGLCGAFALNTAVKAAKREEALEKDRAQARAAEAARSDSGREMNPDPGPTDLTSYAQIGKTPLLAEHGQCVAMVGEIVLFRDGVFFVRCQDSTRGPGMTAALFNVIEGRLRPAVWRPEVNVDGVACLVGLPDDYASGLRKGQRVNIIVAQVEQPVTYRKDTFPLYSANLEYAGMSPEEVKAQRDKNAAYWKRYHELRGR